MSRFMDYGGRKKLKAWIGANFLGKTDCAADAALLGGKPPSYYAGPPVNLMDNSWFIPRYLVNQRGQASYTTLWGMAIDRWYLGSYNSNPSTMTLTENGIRLSGGNRYMQTRIMNIDVTRPHVAGFCINENIVCIYYTPEYIQNAMQKHGFLPVSLETIPDGATIRWAALYEGTYTADTFPPPAPRPCSVELAECQRYYYQMHFDQYETIGMGYEGPDYAFLQLSAPVKMRFKRPSLTQSGVIHLGNNDRQFTSAVCAGTTLILGVNYTAISNPTGAGYGYAPQAGGITLALSAEL